MKTSYDPILGALDITEPLFVEILVREDRKVIWVNVEGVCLLRCCGIHQLITNTKDFPKRRGKQRRSNRRNNKTTKAENKV